MYADKESGYFSHCRMDLLDALPVRRGNRLLEIGAGSGATLVRAKELGLADETVGVELVEMVEGWQRHPAIDRFLVGDVERMELPFAEGHFDAVLCGDVLEHLVDPWGTVRMLVRFLKPGGHFIASLPNIREFKTLFGIAGRGRFAYAEAGILDRTHLRFFCRRDMLALCSQAGLTVLDVRSNLDLLGRGQRYQLNRLTCGLFSELLASQYLLVARKGAD